MLAGLGSPTHLLLILVVILLLFGAKRLPEMGKSLGRGITEFKEGLNSKEEPAEGKHPKNTLEGERTEANLANNGGGGTAPFASEGEKRAARRGAEKVHNEIKDESKFRVRWGGLISWWGGLLAAMLVAVVALTGGCASSESGDSSSSGQGEQQGSAEETTSPSPVQAVQVAYKTTTQEKTAKVDMDINLSGLPAGGASSKQATGTTNLDMTGQGVVDFENQAADFTMQNPLGTIEARQIGGVVYEKLPENLTSQMPGQKPWIKVDLDAVARQQFGTSFSDLQSNASNNPSQQLSYLQGVSDSVQEVGTEQVRGKPATQYTATVDLEKAAEQQGAQQNEQLRQAYDQIEQQIGTSTLPMDVWLDDQNRVVRLETNLPVPVPTASSPQDSGGSDQQGQFTLTEELYDFGTPVSVEEPPEDQTADLDELMAAQKGSQAPQ